MNRIQCFLGIIGILICWRCSDKEEIPLLEISQSSCMVMAKGEDVGLEINSNGFWTFTSNVDWCKPSVESGNGKTKVNIEVKANDSTTLREGILLLRGQEIEQKITISQEALVLGVDTSVMKVEKKGGTLEIKVLSNICWEAKCDSSWVSLSRSSGQDTATILVTLSQYNRNERRTQLYITSGTVSRRIPILQADWHKDGEAKMYRESDAGHPIKIIFMGDGFIEDDLIIGGKYDQTMSEGIEAYFSVEPFKSYRNYFCPYIVYACSQDEGVSTKKAGGGFSIKKNTVFGLAIPENDRIVSGDIMKISEYAEKVPGLNLGTATMIVIGNDPRYGGKTFIFPSGQGIACLLKNTSFGNILIHEGGGHAFGLLADEYVDWTIGGQNVTQSAIKALNGSYAWGANQNVTASKEENVFWKDFIGRPGYESVGFYEGGYYYKKGIWRSEENCCMLYNDLYFCIGCRQAIVKRIKALAGEEFDLDDFIVKDVQKSHP